MLRAQLLGGTPAGTARGDHRPDRVAVPGARAVALQRRLPDDRPRRGPARRRRSPARRSTRRPGAPVIAVQDGEIVQIGDSPSLGRFVSLRDAYGNTYVYAQLGSVAALYPVLQPHEHTAVSARIAQSGGAAQNRRPAVPPRRARSRARRCRKGRPCRGSRWERPQVWNRPRAPRRRCRADSRPSRSRRARRRPRTCGSSAPARTTSTCTRCVRACRCSRGPCSGHVGAPDASPAAGAGSGEPHMFFQIKPAGARRPADRSQADPRRLGGAGETPRSSGPRARTRSLRPRRGSGRCCWSPSSSCSSRWRATPASTCAAAQRQDIQTGRVDKRVLATLEYLSVSGLKPTVSGLRCAGAAPGERRQRVRALRRDGQDHRRQRRADRRPSGSGLDRRNHDSQAADAGGPEPTAADRQPDEHPRHDEHVRRAERARLHTTSPSARQRRRRARGERAGLGAHTERVDQADRAAGRDPRPDGRQRALGGGDPRQARTTPSPASGPEQRTRAGGRRRTSRRGRSRTGGNG